MKKDFSNTLKEKLFECDRHVEKLQSAREYLKDIMPLDVEKYKKLDKIPSSFIDQLNFRFSKLQDVMGAKLFKSFLLFQGENVDKPFLDILNELEKMDIIDVDNWFELRDLRNEIAHEYGDDMQNNLQIINEIFQSLDKIETILKKIEKVVEEKK